MSYKNCIQSIIRTFSIIVCLFAFTFATVMAQEESSDAEESAATDETETSEASEASQDADPVRLEELVVVGTRAQPRSVLDSAVPIDIVSNESFEKQGGAGSTGFAENFGALL